MGDSEQSQDTSRAPRASGGDTLHALGRAGLSAIPFVGGPAVELFNHFISSPLSRRVNEWRERVGERLQSLEAQRGNSLEDLQKDEAFLAVLLQASQTAVRTSSEEKRDALLNAIVNSAAPSKPDAAEQILFLDYIDRFTDWHLRILLLFSKPAEFAEKNGVTFTHSELSTSLGDLLEKVFPELRGKREFYDQVWFQLNQAGLVKTDTLHSMMTTSGALSSRTTELAGRFLAFIASGSDGVQAE